MEIKHNPYAFAYTPKIYKVGTKKYIFYQFFDGATLTLPIRKKI
tara:strand:- start:345 stop:476 length:132 start_codon:yes stop_codon:yes gene_type:complete